MLFTSLRKKVNFRCDFSVLWRCIEAFYAPTGNLKKGVLAVARHLIVWICKVNFRDPKHFISHVCERVRDRNERKWWVYRNCLFMPDSSWADPEGDRPHPWKIGFLSMLVRFPLKSQSYQASIRYWAISGTPAKRHLNGVSLAGQWWPAYSGVWILSPIIN